MRAHSSSTPRPPRGPTLAVAAAVLALAGCGGNGDGRESAATGPTPPLPACAKAGRAIERPADLPGDLPLPPGTRLTAQQKPYAGQLIVRGFVPSELGQAASFFKNELQDAGFELGRGDSERGEEEALFTGDGLRGGWRVNSIPKCSGAVSLVLVLVKQP